MSDRQRPTDPTDPRHADPADTGARGREEAARRYGTPSPAQRADAQPAPTDADTGAERAGLDEAARRYGTR